LAAVFAVPIAKNIGNAMELGFQGAAPSILGEAKDRRGQVEKAASRRPPS
jgi:hypothetical protein